MRLSLAVVAKGCCDPQEFLSAIRAEEAFIGPDVEIHIAHDEPWPPQHGKLPANTHLHFCPNCRSILKLWGIAIARTKGEYVAVLDVQAPPDSGWIDRVEHETNKGTALFFGPVEPGWEEDDRRIAGYLIEYAQFKSPVPADLAEFPGNNLVCRRDLFAPAEELQSKGFFKTYMLWRLERKLHLAPVGINDMTVRYRKPFTVRHYLSRRLRHGRCFASRRHDNPSQPPRLACLAFIPFLPLLRTSRVLLNVQRSTALRAALMRYWPLVVLSETAWSLGEFLGYTCGEGGTCGTLD